MDSIKIVRPEDEKKAVFRASDKYSLLATGEETNNSYFFMEADVPPGAGPPPHVQTKEEEGFYLLEGELVFRSRGEKIVADKGTFLHVPRGVPHHFKNESDKPARLLIFFAPAGIEIMFEKMAASSDKYKEIGKDFGVEFLDTA